MLSTFVVIPHRSTPPKNHELSCLTGVRPIPPVAAAITWTLNPSIDARIDIPPYA